MTADRSYVQANLASLERMRALVDRLSDEALASPMPAGWTVAAVLAHVAFWDLRVVVLLRGWNGGSGDEPPPEDEDAPVDWINDAVKPLILALDPRVAAREALAAAEEADRMAAAMTDAMLARNVELDWAVNPARFEHREEHLEELERTLGTG
jgi:hypothetical protein